MRITGTVVNKRNNEPIDDARVLISRALAPEEVLTTRTGRRGNFQYEDELNQLLGQDLIIAVHHEGFLKWQTTRQAEREFTVQITLEPVEPKNERKQQPPPPPNWIKQLVAWFMAMAARLRVFFATRAGLATLAGAGIAVAVLLVWLFWPRPHSDVLACNESSLKKAAVANSPAALWQVAERCREKGDINLRFAAVEQCAMRELGLCLMTMAGWYDPQMAAEPSPFHQRNAAQATSYYRRALNQGQNGARARLDELCRDLRAKGGTAAAEASC